MDIDHLKRVPLFQNLTSTHLQQVLSIGKDRSLGANEQIFREDEVGNEMFVIVKGQVRISKTVPGVGEEALAILQPGSYFGEMALIDDTPRSADAIAHTPCDLWVIEKEALEELMFLHKDIGHEILWTFVRVLSVRLRETNEKIASFFALASRF